MKPKKLITILALSALVIAAAFGAVAYHSARAASSAVSQMAVSVNLFGDLLNHGRGYGGFSNDDLANALGITVDELTAAQQKAKEAVLAQAVEKDLITQTQADQLKANGFRLPFDRGMGDWLSPDSLTKNGIDYEAELANALGISLEKLQAAYTQAFNASIDQAVTNGKLTQEQADLMKGQKALYADKDFQASMQSAYQSAVQQAVADGVITQAQADLILKNASGLNLGGFNEPGGMGGFEGGHGRRGGMDNDQSTQPTAPTTP